LANWGSRVRQRTPNEAIKSTVDNNIRSFGWKLDPFHSPPATPAVVIWPNAGCLARKQTSKPLMQNAA
jgi:hypothetical protein